MPIYGQEITATICNDTNVKAVQEALFSYLTESTDDAMQRVINIMKLANISIIKLITGKTAIVVQEVESVGYVISNEGIKQLQRKTTDSL